MSSPPNPCARHVLYLVEPHPVAACHLAAALKRNPALKVVACGLHLRSRPGLPGKPSILIIDADALPFPLAPFLSTVKTAAAGAGIVVVANRLSDDQLCGLLSRGVGGFVAYERLDQEICPAVGAVLRGHVWYPPQVLERCAMLSAAMGKQKRPGRGGPSPRESQVIGLLQRGLSNKEIGAALGITERGVRFHLHNISEKNGIHGRYAILEWARWAAPAGPGREVSVWKAA